MPVLNMEVPINTEAYYRGETIARKEGVSLYDKFAQWLNEYIEDADDAAALNDAMERMMARDTHPSNCVRTSGYDMACRVHVGRSKRTTQDGARQRGTHP